MNKAIFLDRDGVINKDYVDYVYTIEKFQLLDGVVEALQKFKTAGYKLVIITNQSGIAKGIYKKEDVYNVYHHIQELCGGLLDELYYAPHNENFTSVSLTRKPGSLMIEKGMAKFDVDPSQSWMVGDKDRDLVPAKKLGIKTALIDSEGDKSKYDFVTSSLLEVANHIV
ncbi:MAG: D-glycero-alpha-D-manno-heptose-1,7-bisphosphate 7-phosphatase [Cyclobacteriaceae bacterium]